MYGFYMGTGDMTSVLQPDHCGRQHTATGMRGGWSHAMHSHEAGEMDTGAQCPSFDSAQDASPGNAAIHSQGGCSHVIQHNLEKSLRDTPTGSSPG